MVSGVCGVQQGVLLPDFSLNRGWTIRIQELWQRKSHYDYRYDFALEKFEKVKILVYHICPKNG